MAAASETFASSNKFEAALDNEHQLTLEFDADTSRLSIELANSSRFVVYYKSFNKVEEIRQTTGTY